MTIDKTGVREREKRKRLQFLFKVVTLWLLLWFDEDISRWGLRYFPKEGGVSVVDNVLKAVTFLLISHILISLGRLIVVRFYLSKKGLDIFKSNFVLGINHIAGILNVTVMVISLMFLFGIRPVEFFTSITIVAAAIALLSKDYITNMINGLIIMFSDQLSLGDRVMIGDHQGRIQDITLLNMELVNEDADIVMIPNSMILTSQVINYSRQSSRKLNFEFELKIHPLMEVNAIEGRLKAMVFSFEQAVVSESFTLKTMEIRHDTVKLKCQFLLSVPDKALEAEIKRKVNQTIIEIAREN